MIRTLVFFIVSSVVIFAITLFFRLGGHKDVKIERRQVPALYLVGKKHTGAYHLINDKIKAVEEWALTQNLPCTRTYGEYYDDPTTKAEDRLQSEGGCVVSTAVTNVFMPADFVAKEVPAGEKIVAEFDGAPSIGPFKVYPAIEEYFEKHSLKQTGSVIEIYNIKNEREAVTEYYFTFAATN